MKWRYILYSISIGLFHCFCWLLVMNFCAVYINSNKEWLIESIISLLLQLFVIKAIFILIVCIVRQLAIAYYKIKFIVTVYKIIRWISKYII